MFENKVLRRIFGPKREEVAGVWRRPRNEEQRNSCASLNASEMDGLVARMGEMRNVYKILVEKSEGKRPLGRPRRRWEDNIRMDLREMEWDGLDWIHLTQNMN
jgi:hypothetical protein